VASMDRYVPGRYLAAVDALRGEHYVGLFEVAADGGLRALGPELRLPSADVLERAASANALAVGPGQPDPGTTVPKASGATRLSELLDTTAAADLAGWEPAYGRLAEAQVKWEAVHGRALEAV
jgi:tRNA threonylcarbamoyladenosine biosynthesis protein TsaB